MSDTGRLAVFITVVLGIWSLEHLYVGWRLLSLPWLAGGFGRRLAVGVLTAGFLAYPLGRLLWHAWRFLLAPTVEWIGAVWMGLLFFLTVALAAAEVLTLGGLVGRPVTIAVRTAAVVVALAAGAAALHGGLRPPRIVRMDVPLAGLTQELEGTTILQLSDLHLGTLSGRSFLGSILRLTEELHPDLIAVTGDLFDSDAEAVEELVPQLRDLRAPLGVYAVLGNHEYYAGAARCTRLMESAGMVVLDGQARRVAPGLWLVGVPDRRGAVQTGHMPRDLSAAVEAIPAGAARVLLHHAPESEETAEALGIGLMLSGHTHGGQIWPFHLLVRRVYPHLAGVYRVGGLTEIVSRGAGRWGPPMRLLAPADVVLVTLLQPRGRGSNAPPETGRSTPVR